MKSYVFKMSFISPVHFGIGSLSSSTFVCGADTLFSAIFQEWLKIFGDAEDLLEAVNNNKFRITDLLPFNNNELYIPKPVLFFDTEAEIDIDKKTMKNMKYIPKNMLKPFVGFLKNGGSLPFDDKISFGKTEVNQKVVIDENGESTPFAVANFRFNSNSGLYFVANVSEIILNKLLTVIESLSESGIGGKRSSGYGKFKFEPKETNDFLTVDSKLYLSLSSIIPTTDDLGLIDKDNCSYILNEKSGFIDSLSYADNSLKKRSVAIFEAGSTFDKKLGGSMVDVSENGNHKVYKYGFSFYLGVDL